MPAVRQNRSKLAPISRQASLTPDAIAAAGVISLLMALLSFVDSAPRAYRLKAGNADPPISTMGGTSPRRRHGTYRRWPVRTRKRRLLPSLRSCGTEAYRLLRASLQQTNCSRGDGEGQPSLAR